MKLFNNHPYMGHKMGRSYKTYSLSALVQAGDDTFNHILQCHNSFFNTSPVSADLKILAIDALQVAVGKENIADAMGAADNRFLAAMSTDGTDVISCVTSAISHFSHITVHPAKSGADHTVVEFFHCPKIKGFRPN
jgi:hypothetical protein